MKKNTYSNFRHKSVLHIILMFAIGLAWSCSRSGEVKQLHGQNAFRVLGYLFSDDNWQDDLDSVNLEQITDINFAFIDPDTAGNFKEEPAFSNIVKTLTGKKIRVFFSIGGGDPPAHLESLIKPGKRESFIRQIVLFAEKYGFNGVDVDLENDLINDDYPGFVAELSTTLKMKGILMTAALASWNADKFHDSTLKRFDFINIMSYDKTGPWNMSRPGEHSPYQMAVDDFSYFSSTRGIAKEKLLIGLPFYGYGFGGNLPASLSYSKIIQQYPGAENGDSLVTGGGRIYYNGISTIKRKVKFAKDNAAAGVIIWQLLQDSRNDKSLLNAVYQSANEK
jgi:chitinase